MTTADPSLNVEIFISLAREAVIALRDGSVTPSEAAILCGELATVINAIATRELLPKWWMRSGVKLAAAALEEAAEGFVEMAAKLAQAEGAGA